jgi:hypothetical protein
VILRKGGNDPVTFTDEGAAPVSAWADMLHSAATRAESGTLRNFLKWQAPHLIRNFGHGERVSVTEIPGVWRSHWHYRLRLAWYPLLLVFLMSPLSSDLLATISQLL